MQKIIDTLRHMATIPSLRSKILFTLLVLVLYRLLANLTIPGANVEAIRTALDGQSGFGFLKVLTGGSMANFSGILMGLMPYINASIIMQLMTVIVPSLENLKKEGESGQKKINQYTRILTVPLAFAQSYGMLLLLNNSTLGVPVVDTAWSVMLPMMLTITAGTMILMWLGELITEKGLGNGISILIFAGIVSTVPAEIVNAITTLESDPLRIIKIIGLLSVLVLLTIFVVYVSEADRRVPVTYTSQRSGSSQQSFLPLKINQSGMIPIIFAISVVSFPAIIAQVLANREGGEGSAADISNFLTTYLNPQNPTLYYNLLYAALIIGFTYFYVSIVFEPKKIAENIQKRNGYIPGFRPGTETENHISDVTGRLCFWGGLFLAFVAICPLIAQQWITDGTAALFITGAGIIIVVGVVLDLIRRINMHLVLNDYEKL